MEAIESTTNPFGGVLPDPVVLVNEPANFKDQLDRSLTLWREAGHKLVWLEIPISKAALVPVAVEAGFSFHHANDTYVMLTRPLVDGAFIPPYATHYIGVGGVVLNDARELLVVSERYRRRDRGPSYKLPGGALHPGENIVDAVLREVFEETGIKTRFEALVCFRHWHGYRFGKSDIYMTCRLSPTNLDIEMQMEEIEECIWMPVEDYLGADNVSPFNKHIVRVAMESPGVVPTTLDGYDQGREIFMPRGWS